MSAFEEMDAVEVMQMDVESEPEIMSSPSIDESVVNITTDVTLDLESYMNSYEGYIRYLRLAYVARHCSTLALEALRHAIKYIYTDTEDYHNYLLLHVWYQRLLRDPNANVDDFLHERIRKSGHMYVIFMEHPPTHVYENMLQEMQLMINVPPGERNGTSVHFDATWVQSMRIGVTARVDELENEMKTALSTHSGSLGKKNTRIPALKLAQLFTRCGDLFHAIRCYTQAVEQCSTAQEEIDIIQKLLCVSVCHSNWMCVDTFINRLECREEMQEFVQQIQRPSTSTVGTSSISANTVLPPRTVRLTGETGSAAGSSWRRGSANRTSDGGPSSSTQTSFVEKEHMARAGMRMLAVTGLSELHMRKYKAAARSFFQIRYELFEFNELLSLTNVAQYAGLCALATFDRAELKRIVFENSVAKQVLEADPDIRDILQCFYQAQYGLSLSKLQAIENNLRLDIYLAAHMDTLIKDIRTKAICQYFSPYLSCDLTRTAAEFNIPIQQLEDEVAQMILDGKVNARIDSQCKILYSRSVDQRKASYENVLGLVDQYKRTINAFLLRNALKRRDTNFAETNQLDENRKVVYNGP